jgi:hypothetical protein
MDAIVTLLTELMFGFLVLTPPIAVWRALSRQAPASRAWLGPGLALLAPAAAACGLVVVLWLSRYEGRCGGWLGETAPCSGFGQYAAETVFWAAMSMAMPALLGIALGIAVLLVRSRRRRSARPTP